jgi:hypothetical protein
MTAPRYIDLAQLLLSASGSGQAVQVLPGYVTAWNGTTRENTVSAGATEYANLPSMFPGELAIGPVVLIKIGDAAPFILGRIYLPDPGA